MEDLMVAVRRKVPGVKIAIFIARGWPARAMWDWGENSHFHRAGVARQDHVGLV